MMRYGLLHFKAFTHLCHAALECCPELLAGLLILLNLLAADRQLSLTAAACTTCTETKRKVGDGVGV
jgi:hypothetical protein